MNEGTCKECKFAEIVACRGKALGDPVYRCARDIHFIHETQPQARCNYWKGKDER